MSKSQRRFVWARFWFWVVGFLVIALDLVLKDHTMWETVLFFGGQVCCALAAADAWKELERSA